MKRSNPLGLGSVVVAVIVVTALGLSACVQLDSFVFNSRQCKVVDPKSTDCTEDHVCTPCDKPYPFDALGIPSDHVKQVTVAVSGGQTVDSYFITGNGARPTDVVIYAHGNFASVEHYLNRVKMLFDMGVNVYAIDYRGMGKSSTADEPDEVTFMDDAHKLRDALDGEIAAAGITNARITVYAYSAGALAGVEIAKYRAPCGLLLEAPWPSVQSFTDTSTFSGIPGAFITTGGWDNIAKMPAIHVPLLQFHGTLDETVQIALGREVFAAANDPKQLIEVKGAGHGNGGEDVPKVLGEAYAADVTGFIDSLDCAAQAP